MDQPAARQRGHRPLPLGIHADGRPGRGTRRDPARARPGRAPGDRGVGLDRAQPVGIAAGQELAAHGLGPPGAGTQTRPEDEPPASEPQGAGEWAAAQQPGPFALGDAGRFAELLADAGFTEVSVEDVELVRRHTSFEEFWDTTLDISRQFHDAAMSLARAAARSGAGRPAAAPCALHRRGRHAADPGAHVGGEGERLSRPLACAPMIYDDDADLAPPRRQDRRHHRLRLAGPRPRPEPQGLGRRRRRRPARRTPPPWPRRSEPGLEVLSRRRGRQPRATS